MRKPLLGLFALLLFFTFSPTPAGAKTVAHALQGTPGEVIALINTYRAENGLPAYQQNSILMQIAQGQADYIASQVSPSDIHAGPGGTRPRDRAYAVGYGDGQTIFVSEIAKYGLNETPQGAVGWWKTSQIHNDTMLASTYVEIGAGVATDGNGRYYYVAVTGYIAGGSYTPSTASSAPEVPAVVVIPVTKAEPQEDGSIVHIIRTGQTLWTLAAVYEVSLEDILALNNLPENAVIYPGDEILIKEADPPTPTPTKEPPPATPRPSSTPAPTPAELTLDDSNAGGPGGPAAANLDPATAAEAENAAVRIVVAIALVSILAVIVASFYIQRPKGLDLHDDDPFAPLE